MEMNTATDAVKAEPRAWPVETAPSEVRRTPPTVARWIGTVGLALSLVGGLAIWMNYYSPRFISETTGTVFVGLGLIAMLFHATSEADSQIRRMYALLGFVIVPVSIALFFVPWASRPLMMLLGTLGSLLGLFFLLAAARHEDSPVWLRPTFMILGGAG